MRAFTSTSRASRTLAFVLMAMMAAGLAARSARADDGFGTTTAPGKSDEDDFTGSPYTEYGEFNEDEDEAATTQYLQYGRFFGVSIGIGEQGATGNRGSLWSGGFPEIDFKLHYWFDFNFALQLGYMMAPHTFTLNGDVTNVQFTRIGVDLKYYFDVRDASSAITFAGPYILLGAGDFTKTQTDTLSGIVDTDNAIGLTAGAGMEFTISPKSVYFYLQGTLSMATFKDTNSQDYTGAGLPDATGYFYDFTVGALFTW